MIYLDYAASTPLPKAILETMIPWFCEDFGNPSSSHYQGRKAAKAVERAREIIADKIGAYPSEIVFTSGATESNNLALKGIALARRDKGRHIITSSIEHKCILSICNYLENEGFEITYVEPNKYGEITSASISKVIRDDTIIVSISHVNNELGTTQPIREIGALCFDKGVLFHTDAAQSFCKLDINVDDMYIDLMSVSAHKCYGPKGIGALYIRDLRETKVDPVIHGAGQELGLRGGTLASPLIIGMGEAVSQSGLYIDQVAIGEVRSAFLNELGKYCSYTINGGVSVIPNILNITIQKLDIQSLMRDEELAISQGSACSSMAIDISHVLRAIGLSFEQGEKTLRISLGYGYTPQKAKAAAATLAKHIS
ncbi:cysteine desulfurase [Pontibacterium sp. N1Y112]|uniref:cysteine desulfurase n=1 Tax=Pontibacterium sinense TaxID=2781979 RepID=A0A8J7FUW4_9GAMM|nr:cysteine desulfurase family protein [Pontibacterium sinense]MBE9397770.1 cysteine desulfurase [Pontibacterium sinense]